MSEKKIFLWFMALSCFLIGFIVGYGVAFNRFSGPFFDNLNKLNLPSTINPKSSSMPSNLTPSLDSKKINELPPTPPSAGLSLSDKEKAEIDAWLAKNNLNEFGDPKDTVYAGGTPLFDETSGKTLDRYEYILNNHPERPWAE